MRAHGLNWGALAYFAACAVLVILLLLLIAAAWLYGKIRRLARKRRDGKLTRAERREFEAARKAYGDVIGTLTVQRREQAAEYKAKGRRS